MKQLSDLLREAKGDAPPLRLDVDDVVAAGRTRRRRRNVGWTLAAVVAVAATIMVPRIVIGVEKLPASVPPAATASASPSPFFAFEYTFRGYTVGRLEVSAPIRVGFEGETAFVTKAGSDQVIGTLHVHQPGVEPRVPDGTQQVETEPVKGRPARIQRWPSDGKELAENLVWEYADGAWAAIRSNAGLLSVADMRAVAEAFRPGESRPVTVGFKFGYVPDGYRVVQATSSSDPSRSSGISLLPASAAAKRLTRPDRSGGDGEHKIRAIQVWFGQPDGDDDARPTKPTCRTPGTECELWLADGRTQLEVAFSGGNTDTSELLRMLESVTPADIGDPTTWYPVSEAVPASAQQPVR